MLAFAKQLTCPYPEAFDRFYRLLAASGYAITHADPQTGNIAFDTPPTLNDWGFIYKAQLVATGPNTTQINFQSRPKFGFDIFHYGEKKIDKILIKL